VALCIAQSVDRLIWRCTLAEGIFAAMMDVQLNNDGPVTILDESDEAAEAEEKEAA
jgi:D-Tyr-tRNAtyr deacylase